MNRIKLPQWLKPDASGMKTRASFKRWVMLASGILLLILAFWSATLWSQDMNNMAFGIGFVFLAGGGGYLIWYSFQDMSAPVMSMVGQTKTSDTFPTLFIKAQKIDGVIYPDVIEFGLSAKRPAGYPQQCLNDGRWYFVQIWDLATGRYKPFYLPDRQFIDPVEFGNVIKMPAHKKLHTRKASLAQRVAPGIMLAGFVIAFVFYIASTPPAV